MNIRKVIHLGVGITAFLSLFLFAGTRAEASYLHPGCRVGDGSAGRVPGPPGLPCLPTEVPSSGSGDDTRPAREGPVRLVMKNMSEKPVSLFLEGPITYVLNVPAADNGSFVIERGSYAFQETACGVTVSGQLGVSRHLEVSYPPCSSTRHVKITIDNQTDTSASVILTGPSTQVLSVGSSQARSFTVPRGDYEVEYYACGSNGSAIFRRAVIERSSSIVPSCSGR